MWSIVAIGWDGFVLHERRSAGANLTHLKPCPFDRRPYTQHYLEDYVLSDGNFL
jgi:hypothetical protein